MSKQNSPTPNITPKDLQGLIIAFATEDDVLAVQRVVYKTWLATYPNAEYGITTEDIEEMFKEKISEEYINKLKQNIRVQENNFRLVAKKGDEIIGCCNLIDMGEFYKLQMIYILPDYQGHGIGRLFWERILEHASRDKIIKVEVATYNSNAISFYKKLGFKDTGRRISDKRFIMPITGSSIPEMEMDFNRV